MVEHQEVEAAMRAFGDELRAFVQSPSDRAVKDRLNRASLNLAHAILKRYRKCLE